MGIRVFLKGALKPALLFLGAYFFSICLTIIIHETGHALVLYLLGYPDIKIAFTPFYGTTASSLNLELMDAGYVLIGGSLFNLLLAAIIPLILWRIRNSYLLPILMYGGTAYLLEGLVLLNTFFTNITLTDWDGLIYLGFPPLIVAILTVIVLGLGTLFMYLIWPLINISVNDSFFRKFFINSGYVIYLFLSMCFMFFTSITYLPDFILLITLNFIFGIIFLIIRIIIYKPIFPIIDRLFHSEVKPVTLTSVLLANGLAISMILFLLFIFH